jgi:hypothetical protein
MSVTVRVIVFTPISEQLKFDFDNCRDWIPQLSVLPLSSCAAVTEAIPFSSVTVSGLHKTTGASVSFTTTLKLQFAVLPAWSETTIFTGVAPTG